jgi:hypothetical protein
MTIRVKSYRTKSSELWLDEEGILWLSPLENAELDLEEVSNCFEVYRHMGIGPENKVFQIIDARRAVQMSKEGRDYAAKHGADFFIASAIISDNFSVRLMVNFFNVFYKAQVVPFRLFDSEESARKWLGKFKRI